jgi:hypothetical protein
MNTAEDFEEFDFDKVGKGWEDEALRLVQEAARKGLSNAEKADRSTSRLPPGYEARDKAVEELHNTGVVARELGA